MNETNEDLVTVFESGNHDAEMEATTIVGLLDASGIPAILKGPQTIPSLDFQVQVTSSRAEEARQTISAARAAGPAAAREAEAETEL